MNKDQLDHLLGKLLTFKDKELAGMLLATLSQLYKGDIHTINYFIDKMTICGKSESENNVHLN